MDGAPLADLSVKPTGSDMRIAISGVGVAGPTLAYWLLKGGHQPTLIESAPALRTGGYMIDFWGVGFAVADRMGLVPALRQAGYDIQEARYLDARGRTRARISAEVMNRELGDQFTSLPRGDLAAILFRSLEDRAETIFGATIVALQPSNCTVDVTLSNGMKREFDLVIGADGLHSKVRTLAFGSQDQFEVDLGYFVAAFEAPGYEPRDELTYVSYGLPARQIWRFAMRDGRTTFLFVFDANRLGWQAPTTLAARKRALEQVFAAAGPEWPRIADYLARASDIYFDRVCQISMSRWQRGRYALVGDAAACVSLVAGEGTGLAMAEAYVLASELAKDPDTGRALASYEARLRPFIDGKQKAARSFAKAFAPRTAYGVWLRNAAIGLMTLPGLRNLLLRDMLRDDFELPEFGA